MLIIVSSFQGLAQISWCFECCSCVLPHFLSNKLLLNTMGTLIRNGDTASLCVTCISPSANKHTSLLLVSIYREIFDGAKSVMKNKWI